MNWSVDMTRARALRVARSKAVTAAPKTPVWFEESGHELLVDEPAKLNAAVVEAVAASGAGPAMTTKGLRVAAIASVAVYGLGDLASGLSYAGYSYRDQWISELSAFGSPVRPLMVTTILVHGLLLLAFGVGIWRVADRKSLRWIGLLLILAGAIGLPTHTVFAMSSRWMIAGFNDIMHASLSLAFGLVVFVAVALSAVAYPGWFRLYAIASIPILVGFGAASSAAIKGIEQNFTPWAGAFERINAYTYFAWLVVLALTVHRSLNRRDVALGGDDGGAAVSVSARYPRQNDDQSRQCERSRALSVRRAR
jgi:hypothetical protein